MKLLKPTQLPADWQDVMPVSDIHEKKKFHERFNNDDDFRKKMIAKGELKRDKALFADQLIRKLIKKNQDELRNSMIKKFGKKKCKDIKWFF